MQLAVDHLAVAEECQVVEYLVISIVPEPGGIVLAVVFIPCGPAVDGAVLRPDPAQLVPYHWLVGSELFPFIKYLARIVVVSHHVAVP